MLQLTSDEHVVCREFILFISMKPLLMLIMQCLHRLPFSNDIFYLEWMEFILMHRSMNFIRHFLIISRYSMANERTSYSDVNIAKKNFENFVSLQFLGVFPRF